MHLPRVQGVNAVSTLSHGLPSMYLPGLWSIFWQRRILHCTASVPIQCLDTWISIGISHLATLIRGLCVPESIIPPILACGGLVGDAGIHTGWYGVSVCIYYD